jgi:hypothetical protein
MDGREMVTEGEIDVITQKWFTTGWEKALEEIALMLNEGASLDAIHNFCLDQLSD